MNFAYILPLLTVFRIQLIGTLSGADIACGILFIFYLLQGKLKIHDKGQYYFYLFITIWFLGQFVTDIYRHTEFTQYARGWSKIIFFAINFSVISTLVGNNIKKGIIFTYLTYISGAIGETIYLPYFIKSMFGEGWKFGFGQLFTSTCFIISGYIMTTKGKELLGRSLPIAASFFNLICNARNMFGLSFISSVVSFITAKRKRKISRKAMFLIFFILIISSATALAIYAYTASHGLLGQKAFIKFAIQSAGHSGTQGLLGILMSGRNEGFASIQAIIDSPILGHGSWPEDYRYTLMHFVRMQENGLVATFSMNDTHIPGHSHLLEAWVAAGITGAIFWVWAIYKTSQSAFFITKSKSVYTGYSLFICTSLLWDIFFSPFGLERKFVTACQLYYLIILVKHYKEQRKLQKNENIHSNHIIQPSRVP